jgi:glutathione S-transferase
MGSGLYAGKLSYKDWYDFNNAQRAHYNYLEMAPTTFLWLLIAGIYFPLPAAALGVGVFVFRLIYAVNYAKKGPGGRGLGAIGNDLALLGLLSLSLASGVKLALSTS